MILSVKNIEKQYENKILFSDISFELNLGHKIALVGKNGSGKSTLLKIIKGDIKPGSGSVNLTKGYKITSLPQEIPLDFKGTALDYIFDEAGHKNHKAYPILSAFSLDDNKLKLDLQKLSGGEKTKILLTKFLLADANILILDEPTNNLDMPSLIWLEEYLKKSNKTIIVVSHDVLFLDYVCDRVFELKDGKLNIEKGKYTDYLNQKQKNYKRELNEYKKQQEEVLKIKENIKILQGKTDKINNITLKDNDKQAASFKKDVASSGQNKIKTYKKKLDKIGSIEKPFEEELMVIDIDPKVKEGNLIIEFDDVVSGYKDVIKTKPFKFTALFGSKICILGENGIGKTTILNTLTGAIKPLEGDIKIGENIKFGNLMQSHENAERSMKVIDFFQKETNATIEQSIYMLKKFGLSEEIFKHSISNLSCGTRARLMFSTFAMNKVNVLILDEPTNHLDIEVVSALKEFLLKYKGTVFLISHNRWFIKDLNIDMFYVIEEEGIKRIKDFEEYINGIKEKAKKMITKLYRIV